MSQFHLTYDELVWGIDWPILQRMIIDGPVYDKKPEDDTLESDAIREHVNKVKNGY